MYEHPNSHSFKTPEVRVVSALMWLVTHRKRPFQKKNGFPVLFCSRNRGVTDIYKTATHLLMVNHKWGWEGARKKEKPEKRPSIAN